ncbi:MAG: NnrS family protein [Bdellovibrionales bacterium]|jgi:uncharacterized protein involved in response to NO|nr:NnrS family protein [Bdellovibrionales bacterium]MBT3525492.1 NnrS family protein [Bdellovibrionales bacterium]MBT7670405.1 NnrS family protein [Bdellovibrionales bacterium]MBT7766531.1 NnrS family protein [Bdellovibrionales bacterium]
MDKSNVKYSNIWLDGYRSFFLISIIFFLVVMALWAVQFTASYPRDTLLMISTHQHAMLMIWGMLGAIFGFILTAFPKNTGGLRIPPAAALKILSSLYLVVSLLSLLAVYYFPTWHQGVTIAKSLFFLTISLYLIWIYAVSTTEGIMRVQEISVLVAMLIGTTITLGDLRYFNLPHTMIVQLFLYNFFLYLIFSILYRVLPFFLSKRVVGYNIQRGPLFLPVLFVILLLRTYSSRYGQLGVVQACDISLLYWIGRELVRWKVWLGFKNTMITFHLLSAIWILVGLTVSIFGSTILPLPAISHIFFMGGFILLIYTISIRVGQGHASLPLVVNWLDWTTLLLFHLVFAIRLFTDSYSVAGFALVTFFILWAVRVVPLFVVKVEQ